MKMVLDFFHREGVKPSVIQAVYRVFRRVMIGGGRFCRRMGLKSSGPAALSCLNEWMAWVMSLSLIQGKSKRGCEGAEGRGGALSGVTREMLVHQGLKRCLSCGSGRSIRKSEIAYGVSVNLMLNYLGEKSSVFMRVGARNKLLPAFSFGFPALALVRASSTFE
jgi:hypothetical protein